MSPSQVSPDGVVLAAGGVVWRRDEAGRLEVVLIHRARYGDWSLPKGKLDAGETDEDAARREVREETTVEVELGQELPSTVYIDRSGKQKRVRYWAMIVVSGSPRGDNEVDRAEWVPLDEAAARLTYPRDAEVVAALTGAIGG